MMPKIKYPNGTGYEEVDYSANKVQLEDTGGLFTATDVEGALAEVKDDVARHMADNVSLKEVHGIKIESGTFDLNVLSATDATASRGNYYKVGKLVTVQCTMAITAKDAGMSGAVTISGLPFIAKITSNGAISSHQGIVLTAGYTDIGIYIVASTGNMRLFKSGEGKTPVHINASEIQDNFTVTFAITYETN